MKYVQACGFKLKEALIMIRKAIEKIETEIKKEKNPYVKVVGEFLLHHLDTNPEDAEKILDDKKTIIKSLEAMRKEAMKKKVGNCAILTDAEGFEVVLKYYGIEAAVKSNPSAPVVKEDVPVKKKMEEKKDKSKIIDFDIKLEDFI